MPQPTDQILILRPGKLKPILLIVIFVIFGSGGVLILRNDQFWMGWTAILFSGLGIAVAALTMVPGASFLRLTSEGLLIQALYRQHPILKWAEVSEFRVARLLPASTRMVVYDSLLHANSKLGRVNRQFLGHGEALPDVHGMKAEELAKLLNQWRSRFRALPGTTEN